MAKILVVDDSGMSRRTLRKILEPEGHQVTEAADGIAALEHYYIDRPDLVLLDLTMTGMYGIEVLTKMREMDAQARVIVASADIQNSTRALAENAGASAFINKPFAMAQVLNAVSIALRGGADGTV
ncbi:MAG: response regulator [Blastocatellia bacterium AA13]|nr:MAG: response regulator [Blastocatellia bacterium AA13]